MHNLREFQRQVDDFFPSSHSTDCTMPRVLLKNLQNKSTVLKQQSFYSMIKIDNIIQLEERVFSQHLRSTVTRSSTCSLVFFLMIHRELETGGIISETACKGGLETPEDFIEFF